MESFDNVQGTHRVVALRVPGREPMRILCLVQKDASGVEVYYVLAECEGSPLKWKSMIRDNTVRRLKDEFIDGIIEQRDVDSLDVETIFFCATEASKA